MQKSILVALTCLALGGLAAAQLPYSSPMDPRTTFLRTFSDANAQDSTPIRLADLGLIPGDTISITRFGDFSVGATFADNGTNLMAVFSSSDVLLGGAVLNRVPGAIDAGPDILTLANLVDGLSTDISQDFRVSAYGDPAASRTLSLTIPVGATHLFLGVNDSYFGDNTDPDGDYAVEIRGERSVSIDVKPGSAVNPINVQSKNVPVAILTTDNFNALSINPASVVFAGAHIRVKNNGTLHFDAVDVNGDGRLDILAHFDVVSLSVTSGPGTAELTGVTVGGLDIRGSDSILVVP